MTDPELVAKRLALVETYVQDLRRLARAERLREDLRERRFVEHTLQLAIQAVLDAAFHIVSDERLGEPESNRDVFASLESAGWLSRDLADTLAATVGFRNILVHGYADVDLDIVEDVLRHRLDDLLAFAAAVRKRLEAR